MWPEYLRIYVIHGRWRKENELTGGNKRGGVVNNPATQIFKENSIIWKGKGGQLESDNHLRHRLNALYLVSHADVTSDNQ